MWSICITLISASIYPGGTTVCVCELGLPQSLDREQCGKCSEYKHSAKLKVVVGSVLRLSLKQVGCLKVLQP